MAQVAADGEAVKVNVDDVLPSPELVPEVPMVHQAASTEKSVDSNDAENVRLATQVSSSSALDAESDTLGAQTCRAALRLSSTVSPKTADACIAGFALSLGALALHVIDLLMGKHAFPLFAAPILPSSMIFFGGPTPPPLRGFAMCTVGAWLFGFAIRFSPLESGTELCLAAGLLLSYFRLSGSFFVPAVGLSVFLVSDTTGIMSQPLIALHYLFTPWLSGNLCLYGFARVTASGRRRIRAILSKAKFKATLSAAAGEQGDEALREIFRRYDTSGDGFLQAGELKFAWQVMTGEEMTEDEAQALVESVDTDGNNEIDLDEFIALVRENIA